jgi:2,5-diketo-D-gluconate reductase A
MAARRPRQPRTAHASLAQHSTAPPPLCCVCAVAGAGGRLAQGHTAGMAALLGLGLLGSAAAISVPTVEVSKGVYLPVITMGGDGDWGGSNYSLWLELGGRGFDTAWEYQTSRAISEAVRSSGVPRSEVFITHKIPGSLAFNCTDVKCKSFPELPPVSGHYTPDMARHFLAHNLQRLGPEIGYVDLLLLHTPCNYGGAGPHNQSECAAIYEVLEEAVQNGTARAIGVSNYGQADLEALLRTAKITPVVNQCHAAIGTLDVEAMEFGRKHSITYQAWSPLHSDCLHDPKVETISAAHSVSVYQVAMRWLEQNGVPLVTSANSSAYMTSDLASFGFNLTAQEMATLDGMKCGWSS